jgi:hypothetical protein
MHDTLDPQQTLACGGACWDASAMPNDALSTFARALHGRACVVGKRDYDWALDFGDQFSIAVLVPWRIVRPGGIAFAITLPAMKDGRLPIRPRAAERRSSALVAAIWQSFTKLRQCKRLDSHKSRTAPPLNLQVIARSAQWEQGLRQVMLAGFPPVCR